MKASFPCVFPGNPFPIPLLAGSPFYYNQGVPSQSQSQGPAGPGSRPELGGELDVKSPLAATRANSGASAASPTGSACMKQESSMASQASTPTATATPTAGSGGATSLGQHGLPGLPGLLL